MMCSKFQIDFWTYPTNSLDRVEIHVEPIAVQKLESFLNGAGISYTVSQQDVQKIIQQEQGSARAGGFDGQYHRLGEVIFNFCIYWYFLTIVHYTGTHCLTMRSLCVTRLCVA